MDEIDKMFDTEETEKKEDILTAPLKDEADETGTDKETDKENPDEDEHEDKFKKNRHHRRLEKQLQDERDARILMEGKLKAIDENSNSSIQVDERLSRMYGTEEGGKEAALLHQQILNDEIAKAKKEIIDSVHEERVREQQEVKRQEEYIDSELESLEDDLGIDLTSNAPSAKKARNGFLEALMKLSPKDESGNIKEYADAGSAWEYYTLKNPVKPSKTAQRQKELSSKGMDNPGNADATKAKDDSQRDYLRSIGINI